MPLKGKKILVTGGTGAIGGRLVEKLFLEQQAEVRVLVRNFSHASRIARFPIEMIAGDIGDESSVDAAVRGCDVVFHCAYDFSGKREQQEKAGVGGTENIAKAVLKHNVSRLVHVSTISVYEPTADGDLDETATKEPCGWTYADTKLAAEQLVLDYHYKQGLPVAIVQPTIVYGPFVPSWTLGPVNQLKNGKVVLVNNGEGWCNAVYIDDVIDAMILAATREEAVGEAFLISGAEPVTWKEFFAAYEKALGIKATISMTYEEIECRLRKQENLFYQTIYMIRDPRRLLRTPLAAKTYNMAINQIPWIPWESIKNALYTQKNQLFMPDWQQLSLYRSRTRVRIDKAHKVLGYEPRFRFEQGMEMTARFIKWANLI